MSRTKKKSIFLIITLVLFALVGGISQAVYSKSESKVVIRFNSDKVWECKKQFDDKWYISTAKKSQETAKDITFKVDLRNYSKKDSNNTEVPFKVLVKNQHTDNNVTDETNKSSVTVVEDQNKLGIFNVTFKADDSLAQAEKIILNVIFDNNNSWGIEGQNLEFSLIPDSIKPILNIKNLSDIEKTREFKEPVMIACSVEESNLSEVDVEIHKIKSYGSQEEILHQKINWNDKANVNRDYIDFTGDNEFNVKFNEDAYYEVYITLIDKAGNRNDNAGYKIYFQKNKFEYQIDIYGAEQVTNNNYVISKNNKLTFKFGKFSNIMLDSVPYTLTKENSPFSEEGKIEWGSKEFTFQGNGTYKLDITVVKWGVINSTSKDTKVSSYTITIDDEAPKISACIDENDFALDGANEYYFNDFKNIKMNVTDPNLTESNIEVFKDGKFLEKGNDSLDLNACEEGLYEVHIKAFDIAKNGIDKTYKFHVDNHSPEIKIEGVEDNEKIKKGNNETRKVKVSVTDATLNEAQAVITKKDKDKEEVKTIQLYNGQIYEFEAAENGTYLISVTADDKAGNPVSEKNLSFKRDDTIPEIKLKVDDVDTSEDLYQEQNMPHIKNEHGIKIDAFINEDYPKLNEDGSLDNEASYIKVFRTPVNQDAKEEAVIEGDWEYFTTEKSITLTDDGKYKVKIYTVDECGNDKEISLFFVLDGTPPELSVTGVKDYYSGLPEIKIESKDAFQEEGSISIIYEKIVRNLDGNDVSDGIKTKTIEIDSAYKSISLSDLEEFDEEAQYKILEIKAVDKVGNVSKKEDINYIIDTTTPTKSIDGLEDGKLYYNSDRVITIDSEDVNLNKDKVKLTIYKDGEVYEPNKKEVTEAFVIEERKAHGVFTFTSDGEYKVRFESEDMAGNGANDVLEKDFIIDQTLPAISIDDYSLLNGYYINYDRTVTVRVNEKYLESDINLTYVNIVKKYPDGTMKDNNYVFNLSGENSNYLTVYNEFTEDAEYKVTATAKDKAGNIFTSVPLIFTVDKTAPVQTITGADNDAYYNEDKNLEFLSIDNNQDINTVQVTKDGEPYSVGRFTIEGVKDYLNYLFSSEGTYDITFTTTDKANNTVMSTIKFVIDKTAPQIKSIKGDDGSEIKFGEYINRIFTPQFVLDKSEDFITEVTLNGVDITGNVSMASQEMEYNYSVTAKDKSGNVTTTETSFTVDTTNPAIAISGIMSGFFNEDLTPEFDITDTNLDYANTSATLNGQAFTSGTKVDAQDDFNLKLIGTDLATNSNSQSISFTIDKEGPVISFKNPIAGKYFTEDFIPEFLIKDLSDYTIIALTLDGEEYHIGDVIEEEGKHVLYIEVMDKASNTSELTVEFILDKTAPKFLIDGVRDGETYYDAISAEIMMDNPLDTINTVTVNGEASDGETTEEYGQQIVKLNFNDIKDYEVMLKGTDEAGNTTIQTLNFTVAEKTLLSNITTNKKLLYTSIAAVCGVFALGITRFILRRKRVSTVGLENTNEVEE